MAEKDDGELAMMENWQIAGTQSKFANNDSLGSFTCIDMYLVPCFYISFRNSQLSTLISLSYISYLGHY